MSVAQVLDISQRMYGQHIDDARLTLDDLLAELLDPGDEVFVIATKLRRLGEPKRRRMGPSVPFQ
jgi:hypothetical protein